MKGKKIAVIAIMLVVFGAGLILGLCSDALFGNKSEVPTVSAYNAKILENVVYRADFKKDNRTQMARYENDDNDPSDPYSEKYYVDTDSPKTRTCIIRLQDEFERVFESCPTVDFDKEMVVVYIYSALSVTVDETNTNGWQSFEGSETPLPLIKGTVTDEIGEVTLSGDSLNIEINEVRTYPRGPYEQCFLAIKLDNVDVDRIEVNIDRTSVC